MRDGVSLRVSVSRSEGLSVRVPLCSCVTACLCMWLCACVYQCECAAGSVAVRRATLCLCRYLCVEGIDVRRATLCLRRCESACVCVSV